MKSTPTTPALQYLALCKKHLQSARRDLAHFTKVGALMAEHMLKGGELFTPKISRYWPSEFMGRSGGLMGLLEGNYQPTSKHDVAYITLPTSRPGKPYHPAQHAALQNLIKSPAQIIFNGHENELTGLDRKRFAACTGGALPEDGLHQYSSIDPLCPLRPLTQFVRGWCSAGEMVAACTRAGKMPILWMSVWLEGGFVRNMAFKVQNNIREPWRTPLFHDEMFIPPLAPGYATTEFLNVADMIQRRLCAQSALLAQAGKWLADAKKQGKKTFVCLIGHSYPYNLDLPELEKAPPGHEFKFDYPLQWGHSRSNVADSIPANYGKGDVALHLGYAPVQMKVLKKFADKGVKVIHTSPYGKPLDWKAHENILWFDLPWRPADATVDIPGYSVRMLPMSSTAMTMALFAILSEMAARCDWS